MIMHDHCAHSWILDTGLLLELFWGYSDLVEFFLWNIFHTKNNVWPYQQGLVQNILRIS